MSFSMKIKSEILLLESEKSEKISLLSAYIRNNAVITEDSILVNTENIDVSKYIYNLLKELYAVTPLITVRRNYNFKKTMSYLLKISKNKDIILKDLSLINDNGYFINIPKEYIYDGEEEKKSYLRGLFLSTGSVNDPKTARYHLEFFIDDYEYSLFVCELLDSYYLNSKIIERNNGFMVYIKEAEKISDFLKILKAYNAVLYFEDIKAYREQKNLINRLNNCEQANVEKTINSANELIKDIELIENTMGLDALDEKLKIVATYRKKYKEESLNELSNIISMETSTKVTKSGLNHRIRKIREIAKTIENGDNMNKKGFTLVELIAVIAVLAIILVIAIPKILNTVEESREKTFIESAKGILRQIEYDSIDTSITSRTQLSSLDINISNDNYDLNNSYVYVTDDKLQIDLVGAGKYDGYYACEISLSNNSSTVSNQACS